MRFDEKCCLYCNITQAILPRCDRFYNGIYSSKQESYQPSRLSSTYPGRYLGRCTR